MSENLRPSPLGLLLGRAARLVEEYEQADEAQRKYLVALLGEAVDGFWAEQV